MKKNIFLICFLLISAVANSQTIQQRLGLYSTGLPGKIYNDTVYTLPRTSLKYFTGYGTWGTTDSLKGIAYLIKNAARDSFILVRDDSTRFAVKDSSGSGGSSPWSVSGTKIYTTDTTAKVGVGTTIPLSKLYVRTDGGGNTPDSASGIVVANKTAATNTVNQGIVVFEGEAQGWKTVGSLSSPSRIRLVNYGASGSANPNFLSKFQYNVGGGWIDLLSMSGSGGVGGAITAGTSTSITATSFVATPNGVTAGASLFNDNVSIGTSGNFYAQLDMRIASRGFGLPSNTQTQINTWTPIEKLSTYNSTTKLSQIHNGTNWNSVAQWGYTAVTSTYSILITDFTVDCTSGTFTATLPTAVGAGSKHYVIKNSGSGAITVATTSSQTIDGSATYSLPTQYKYVTVQSNNANWIVIANN